MTPSRPGLRRLFLVAALLCAASPLTAHLNSPDIYLEESIGPYPAIIVVHMPPAVPGEASVQVLLLDRDRSDDVRVRVQEIPPDGEEHAPDWVLASRTADPDMRTAPIPLMVFGVWKAKVEVSGNRGEGTVEVPIPANRPNPGAMDPRLAVTLLVLLAILLGSGWQILGALKRDSIRDPASEATAADVRAGRRLARWGTALIVLWLFFISYSWYQSDRAHRARGAPRFVAAAEAEGGPAAAGRRQGVRLELRTRRGQPLTEIVSDQGKPLHVFGVRMPEADHFFHAHPTPLAAGEYRFELRPPSAGRYRLFNNFLHASGEQITLPADLEVAAGSDTPPALFGDVDDSWSRQPAIGATAGATTYDVGDGLVMRWLVPESGPVLESRQFVRLGFALEQVGGEPVASLEPYVGAAGQMMVMRHDGEVFAHLRPSGSVKGRAGAGVSADSLATNRVGFPYGFPEPGAYRAWVQLKHAGKVYTGVFDLEVE